MFILLIVITLCVLGYIYLSQKTLHWKNKGVKYVEPRFLFGNMYDNIMQKATFADVFDVLYKAGDGERYFGVYQFLSPTLLIRDPELIKKTGIKDFDAFQDHTVFSNEEIDPLWSKNLFSSKGEKWHAMRPTLSPSFTSSKMKAMFTLVSDCASQFSQFYLDKGEKLHTIEMKDAFTRFANDTIATCAFGVNCNSLEQRDNDFYLNGLEATDFSGLKGLKFFGYKVSPTLMKLLQVKVISTPVGNFFRKIIKNTIQLREEKGIVRPDMIHLLLEARKGKLRTEEQQSIADGISATHEYSLEKNAPKKKMEISDEDITAQAMIFFIAGFDTSSTLMVYLAYELAVNQDIQDKVKAEMDAILQECGGKITYDALMKMKYLDMVIAETLRKWPPAVMADRMCNRDYVIPAEKPGEKDLILENGSAIIYPIYSLHHDPKYFPDPKKFDPERFSDENKAKIVPNTYIPFGVGPRNCIGSRFALMESKTLFFHILNNFKIVPVKESVIPAVLSKKHFNMNPEGGMWLGLERRL